MIRSHSLNHVQYLNFNEIVQWCNKHCGKGAYSRFKFIDDPSVMWGYHDVGPGSAIFFRDDKIYNWFILAWT
jgi:hypothetical protein